MTGANLLLADDDPVMRELAAAKLAEAGYCAFTAENGEEALEKIRAGKIDLIISDIEMPVMDGIELIRSIRGEKQIADTPIIAITASDDPKIVDRIFAEGATSFLAKPINWTLFNQAVMFVLRAHQAQASLKEARDRAEAGSHFKDALMSVMSHELRTPLNAIIGFGQLLDEQFKKQNDPLHREYAEYIVDGGKRLLESVSDMLLASDARSGPLTLNETDVLLGDIVDAAKTQAIAGKKTQNFELNVRLQNAEFEICCDKALMTKAVWKLLDNAIRFSSTDAEITIGAARSKNGGLALMVKDNGPGIPEAKLSEVSAPFAQSDMSLKRSKEGLGLGIPMTKAIAAAHNAQFRLHSTVGEGTRAVIVLPPERVVSAASSKKSAA